MKLCPVIKDMIGEDDTLQSYQKQGKAIAEILARVSHLQQFITGSGSDSSNKKAPRGPYLSEEVANLGEEVANLGEEMQLLRDQAQSIMKTLSSVADVNIQIIDHIREQPELKQLTLEGVSLTL